MTDRQPLIPTFLKGLPVARAALTWARELHGDQRRDSDHAPFILHPLEVASLLYNREYPEQIIVVALLHDTLEKTSATEAEITSRFGPRVAELVEVLTEDAAIEPYEARKLGLRKQIAAGGPPATAIYAADKICKVRELRARAGRDLRVLHADRFPARERLEHYVFSLHMLEDQVPDNPLVRQLRFELEALRALPPSEPPAGDCSGSQPP